MNDFRYDLPEERIAKYPLEQRDLSKLLVYQKGEIYDSVFQHIDQFIPEDSSLFYNNTKVIHARLAFRKKTGAAVEIFCLSPIEPVDYQQTFGVHGSCTWKCMVGNLKKWKNEILEKEVPVRHKKITLYAEKAEIKSDAVIIKFTWDTNYSFGELLEAAGNIPIPPYLNRESESIDTERYQTVYSKHKGSVAAPTEGLHFTSGIIDKLKAKNISVNEVTLHVGAGTFQPVKSSNALEHIMHTELVSISTNAIQQIIESKDKILATGTTTLRTLESLYWFALKSVLNDKLIAEVDQWIYRENLTPLPFKDVLSELLIIIRREGLSSVNFETSLMIVPGYRFRIVEGLITNYHQPGSTLLLLVASFVGNDWKKIYDHALKHDFRFLSYGDSSLLWRI